ncbi:MAG: acetyl-CoA carboxylase biotin carboxylase subunit [Bacteroidota bacterium]
MKRLLVANRGEIAIRVMSTAKKMGITTVAIYSKADKDAPFTKYADEAYYIGESPSAKSYLNQERIIELCLDKKIDAIHPGYGFLSENADFALLVEQSGIIFVGPESGSMRLMGDKLRAKEAVENYGIPLLPGTEGAVKDINEAKALCESIGYPVLIKASAGGGGKGMRIVENKEEFEEQMKLAVSEAKSAFGNGEVFIEKYITSPRHIEFQVLADKHGNIIHLFDRECSIQRRHQKVIEEAPSSVLDDKLREEMGKAAVDVAKSCNYVGAGTVEFLLDENKKFYFMEMNTRLQVEHPVTEYITGVDLVEQQIKVARGEKLSILQNDLSINGHAVELRVYAEDPRNNFLPDIGALRYYKHPEGENIRVDDGYEEGMKIPIYYDPMLSKLITYGSNREEAIDKMIEACQKYKVVGPKTTLGFGRYVMKHEAFRSGDFDTHFIKNHFSVEKYDESYRQEEKMGIIFAASYLARLKSKKLVTQINLESNWKRNRML